MTFELKKTEQLTPLEALGLACIGWTTKAIRDKLDMSEFFGLEDEIEALKADEKAALKEIVSRPILGVDWDGKSSLMLAVIEALKTECAVNRAGAFLASDERDVSAAQKILLNHKKNGGIPLGQVENARKVLADYGEKLRNEQKASTV